jgi:hypothetical protein
VNILLSFNLVRTLYVKTFYVLIVLIAFGLLGTGCSPRPVFLKPDYKNNPISRIAVMPVVDARTNIKDPEKANKELEKIQDKLSNKLMDRDYDVMKPVNSSLILNENGIKENEIPSNIPKICNLLKVDGVLLSTLKEYNFTFMINSKIDMDLGLYKSDNDTLWIHQMKVNKIKWLACILTGVCIGFVDELIADFPSDQFTAYFGSLPKGAGDGKEIQK